ncbi:hypothetical protein GQ53DRAFT_822490 [Thozetella sp. PMI_491]|nr:hypothetical protein GQ53DRAFT_822490 [Thozetella sp. PMI_491]
MLIEARVSWLGTVEAVKDKTEVPDDASAADEELEDKACVSIDVGDVLNPSGEVNVLVDPIDVEDSANDFALSRDATNDRFVSEDIVAAVDLGKGEEDTTDADMEIEGVNVPGSVIPRFTASLEAVALSRLVDVMGCTPIARSGRCHVLTIDSLLVAGKKPIELNVSGPYMSHGSVLLAY